MVGIVLDGRYRIEAPIARGGMSTVYRGTDLRLDRPVAVKVMDPQLAADPQFRTRFEFEARAVAKLSHPGLVAVYDQGLDGEHAFLVMELVEGGTLRELLRERGPMPPHAAAAVTAPVLGALAVAHRAGLVHRDVKPENILISDSGEVKIADFGLVRAVAAATTTSRSVILGTAAYLSPEQVTVGNADARSDVYSAGVVLFEMLTGRTPFTGDTSLSVAYQRVEKDVPDPGSCIDGVPPEFDRLVRRATEREPGQRFDDAGTMAEALGEVCDTLQLPRYRVPAPRPTGRQDAAEPGASSSPVAAQPVETGAATVSPQAPSPSPASAVTVVHSGAPATAVMSPVPAGSAPMATQHTRVATTAQQSRAYVPAPVQRPDYALERRTQRHRTLGWIIAVLVVALLLGYGGWWLGAGRLATVPVIAGLDRVAAVSALEASGVPTEIRGEYSDDAPLDAVLGTDPVAGERVSDGETVALLVSLGRPTVPKLPGGGDRTTVEDELRRRTFEPVDGGTAFSNTVPEGGVAALDPGPGTELAVGSSVKVIVSKGSSPVEMPDVSGKKPDAARSQLEQAGLTVVDTREVFDPDVDNGQVSTTDPAAGTRVGAGSGVTLLVSNAVKIPSLLGRTVSAARDELERLGLDVEVRQVAGTDRSVVIGQSPGAGDRVEPGSTVTLTALP